MARAIAQTAQALENCRKSGNTLWAQRHQEYLDQLAEALPRGAGIDSGTSIDEITSRDHIRLNVPFHAMNQNGYYVGWLQFTLNITPAFDGIDVEILIDADDLDPEEYDDLDVNGLMDYLAELYQDELTKEAPERNIADTLRETG